jgi:hypothetical protein
MSMQARHRSRRHRVNLLGRAPCGVSDIDRGWATLIGDPIARLGELADLVDRGLLSREEFDRLKARLVPADVVTWSADAPSPRRPRVR